MSITKKLAGLVFLGAAFVSSVASATVVYSEDFQNAAFQGTQLALGSGELFSERYQSTNYFNILAANGWTFTTGTYLAVGSTGDAGVLLNENGGSALTLVGLTSGQQYVLTFNHSGDNRLNLLYNVGLTIGGVGVLNVSRSWSVTGPGVTETVYFTAASNSVQLLFGENSSTSASAIIDNILIQTVPQPGSLALLGLGLMGLGFIRRRKA